MASIQLEGTLTSHALRLDNLLQGILNDLRARVRPISNMSNSPADEEINNPDSAVDPSATVHEVLEPFRLDLIREMDNFWQWQDTHSATEENKAAGQGTAQGGSPEVPLWVSRISDCRIRLTKQQDEFFQLARQVVQNNLVLIRNLESKLVWVESFDIFTGLNESSGVETLALSRTVNFTLEQQKTSNGQMFDQFSKIQKKLYLEQIAQLNAIVDRKIVSIERLTTQLERQVLLFSEDLVESKPDVQLTVGVTESIRGDIGAIGADVGSPAKGSSSSIVEFPKRGKLEALLKEDYEVLANIHLVEIAMNSSSAAAFGIRLSDGTEYVRNPKSKKLRFESLVPAPPTKVSSQPVRRVTHVDLYHTREYLTGIVFFDEFSEEICETGIVGDGSVKRIELRRDENIVGFRARVGNDYAFQNFQFITTKKTK